MKIMNKSAIETLENITSITQAFLLNMQMGYKEPQRGFLSDVKVSDLFQIYTMLKSKEHNVRLFVPGEFSLENYTLVYELCTKNFIFIDSEEAKPLKPKIKLIN